MGAVLHALETDASFRRTVADGLAAAPNEAFFFELVPATTTSSARAFEAVIIDAPSLARVRADADAFAEHFAREKDAAVVAFPNLGGDAFLVVPTPRGATTSYVHLAAFVRGAPRDQVDAFLECVARAVRSRLSSAPLWVSTAGLGVSWLHMRLDSKPKYYRHAPYHAPPE